MASSSSSNNNNKSPSDKAVAADFTSFYLQRATREFAEDLDKVRGADDFRADNVPLLVHALQQGTALFSPAEQRRVVTAAQAQDKPSSLGEERGR